MATSKKTSTTKTTTGTASATSRAETAKAAPAGTPEAVAAAPAAEGAATPGPTLSRKELLARVRKTSGVAGKETRAVVDAVLHELGAALERGETLRLPPLGIARVQRSKSSETHDMLVLKLKRKKPAEGAKDPLAEADE